MKKLLLLLILSFFSTQGLAASCPDGSEPVKSVSADGTYFVYNCGGSNEQTSSSSTANSTNANSNIKAVAGIDIENDPNIEFFTPPLRPTILAKIFMYAGLGWQMADFNNDGYSDVLYRGAMNPDNYNPTGEDTSGTCGGEDCTGDKPLPALFLGDADKRLTYSPELIIDNREDSGMSGARQILVADYNNDNILDFYIADHGIGTHDGVRDSYFLSQPNGTWLESSKTHLSHSNFVVFDHGGATGDIDNDGDMDVVITELASQTRGTAFWCLINNGTGFLKKRPCGGTGAAGLELADIDGDGDLDALVGAHEHDKYNRNFTGIVWNDGKGNFPKHNTTPLPQHKNKWGTIPEVSASDLDNDGDLDIVYSRAGVLYVGTAIQIIENLGNKKFKDHGIFPLVEAPADFIPTNEGNEWNDFIGAIKFRDLDKDGDNDIYLMSSGSTKTNGMVLLNHGDFSFELQQPSTNTYHSNLFSNLLSTQSGVRFEGEDSFTPFDSPIPLAASGALLMGFNDLVYSQTGNGNPLVKTRVHIKFGGHDISTNMAIQWHPKPKFMAARFSFYPQDWGGAKKIYKFGNNGKFIGTPEANDNYKDAMDELGIYAVLKDVQTKVMIILEALDKQKATYFAQEKAKVAAAKAKRLAEEKRIEEEKLAADQRRKEKNDAMKAELAADISRIKAEVAAEVAAAKAKRITEEKRIAEETAIIAAEEQAVLDELAEFEAELEAELLEENKSSPLFDGRYSFDLFRYHDDEDWQELGNGFVEIKNGEIMIDKDNSDLKTGSTDLYDTFSGQVNKNGKVSASVELDILGAGVDRSEVYHLNGQINEKVWGDSPREDFFRVYMLLVKK